MAIQPIDLQTLYAQMAKIGKQQGAEQQSASMVRDAQQQQNKIDAEKKLSSVQLVESNNQNLKINQDSKSPYKDDNKNEKGKKQTASEADINLNNEEYIKDPSLGQRVDISG